jgi:hypothetical protein
MEAIKPLNYAPHPPAAQRIWRFVYRLILFAAIVLATIQWGSGLWRHAESLYWERKCLVYTLPPSHVVFEMNRSNIVHSEVCIPQNRFMGMGKFSGTISDGTIFLHEMRRPNGRRYLVSVICSTRFPNGVERFRLQCLQWSLSRWNISLWPQLADWNEPSFMTAPITPLSHCKFFAGQPDANNPSHFTFDYDLDGTRYTCDAWLNNDGQLIVSQRP